MSFRSIWQLEKMTRQLFEAFYQIGAHFGTTGEFDQKLIQKLSKPERHPKWSVPIFKLLMKTVMGKFYWNKQFIENNVYKDCLA